jgi:hypothetical protein
MGQVNIADLPDELSGMFFRGGLDDPNQVGIVGEIGLQNL